MKVRNIKAYVQNLINEQDLIDISKDDNPLILKFQGQTKIKEDYIPTLTSFAGNSYSQVFFEMLQNAEDEDANRVAFFYDENCFIIINNGIPFKTCGTTKSGQLEGFLKKGKGGKSGEKGKKGKYGQGSKLLYDLISDASVDSTNYRKRSEKLLDEIVNNNKGLVVYSWSDAKQLESLIYDTHKTPDYTGDFENNDLPLLIKTIYTYYPAYVGDEKDTYSQKDDKLFTQKEFDTFRQRISKLISGYNIDFERGTIIYVPIGNGVKNEINKLYNEGLKDVIQTSMFILDKLEEVRINNDLITKSTSFKKLKLKDEAIKADIYFPRNPALVEKNELVNFYQNLPITEELHGLKYVIDSDKYELDSARQNIEKSGAGSNTNVLNKISSLFCEKITSLQKENNIDTILFLTKTILYTDQNKINGTDEIIKGRFYDDIIFALKQNLPTEYNDLQNSDSIRINTSGFPWELSGIGVSDQYWLSPEFKKEYQLVEDLLGIKSLKLIKLIKSNQNNKAYINWLTQLNVVDYQKFINIFKNEKTNKLAEIANLKIIRISDNNIYTLSEIINNPNVILIDDNTKLIQKILKKQNILYGGEEFFELDVFKNSVTELYDKLAKNRYDKLNNLISISDLKDKTKYPLRDQKWDIFKTLKNIANEQNNINELVLFKNKKNELKPLFNLHKEDSIIQSKSSLLDYFTMSNEEPYFDDLNECFLTKGNLWETIIEQLEEAKQNIKASDFLNYINDLNSSFNTAVNNTKIELDVKWLLIEKKWYAFEELFHNPEITKLNEEEYKRYRKLIFKISDSPTLEYKQIKDLSRFEFYDRPVSDIDFLEDNLREEVKHLQLKHIKILKEITKSPILNTFNVKEDKNGYILSAKKSTSKEQFLSANEDLNKIASDYFTILPSSLKGVLGVSDGLMSMEKLLDSLLKSTSEPLMLAKYIKEYGNETLKNSYLTKLGSLDIIIDNSKKEISENELATLEMISRTDQIDYWKANKILFNGSLLEKRIFNNKIEVKQKKNTVRVDFTLSELLPSEYDGKTNVIEDVRISLRNHVRIKDEFFKTKSKRKETIYTEIQYGNTITQIQALYILAFLNSEFADKITTPNKQNALSKFILTGEQDKISFINQLFLKKIDIPANHKIPEFPDFHYLYAADEKYLLNIEIIPSWIHKWLRADGNQEVIGKKEIFLGDSGVKSKWHPIIKYRKALFNRSNDSLDYHNIISNASSQEIKNTVQWIYEKKLTCEFGKSGAFDTLLNKYYDNDLIYGLKFNVNTNNELYLSLQELPTSLSPILINCFQTSSSIEGLDEEDLDDILVESIKGHNLNLFHFRSRDPEREKNILLKEASFEKEFDENSTEKKEWDSKIYRQWKQIKDNPFSIYIPEEISFKYYLDIPKGTKIFIKNKVKNNHYLKKDDATKRSIFLSENAVKATGETIIKYLIENEKDLFQGNKSWLIKLLNLLKVTEEELDTLELIREKGITKEQLISLLEKQKNGLLDANSPFGEGGGLVVTPTTGGNDDGGKETQANAPNLLIGDIGEFLVYRWLEIKYKNDSLAKIEHVAKTKLEGKYDIYMKYNGVPFYIDVKTNAPSLKNNDQNVAFFVKKQQLDFIRKFPDKNYYVIRVSLADVGLSNAHERLKIIFNKNNDATNKDLSPLYPEILKVVNDFLDHQNGIKKLNQGEGKFSFRLALPKNEDELF